MYFQFAMATLIIGSLFSLNANAIEVEVKEDQKRRTIKMSSNNSFEDVVDIHNSAVITAHPTQYLSSKDSITELRTLRKVGEVHEVKRQALYTSRHQPFPVRFEGD